MIQEGVNPSPLPIGYFRRAAILVVFLSLYCAGANRIRLVFSRLFNILVIVVTTRTLIVVQERIKRGTLFERDGSVCLLIPYSALPNKAWMHTMCFLGMTPVFARLDLI
jgi:hypothetical protein